jgi:hypothetical protein
VFNLSSFHFQSDTVCGFPDPQGLLAKYGIPLCSGIVAVAFFFAGSYLLQLKKRFHADLREPTDDGICLERFSRILGNSRARIFFALFGAIIIAFQWRDAQLPHPISTVPSPITVAATWLDAWGNCFAHLTFGLGLLRELNRERRDFVGMASACSMLFYGLVQLTSLQNALFFDGYIPAALLKFALVLTMLSFGAMIKQMSRARDEERDAVTNLLIMLNSNLRHELKKPLELLDLGIASVANAIPELSKDLVEAAREAAIDAKDFFICWSDRIHHQQESLSRFFTKRKFVVKQENDDDLYEAWVPPLFLQWTVARLRENARAAGATEITITLSRGINEKKEPVVIAVMSNNGRPMANGVKLFAKDHGTWVARYLMQLAGGTLEWKADNSQKGLFQIALPTGTPES